MSDTTATALEEKKPEPPKVPKLNPEAKKAWLEVLRSDDVVQLKDDIHDGKNGYCALGAFCEAYRRKFPDKAKWVLNEESKYWYLQIDGLKPGDVMVPVYEWLGVPAALLMYNGFMISAVCLNYRISFKELADLIDAQL